MNLYEINRAIESFEFEVNEDGEVLNFAELDELQMARGEKIENIACYIKNLTANANAIREEEKSLAERRTSIEKKAARLRQYLADMLNGEKFESARCAISYRKSTVVEFDNEAESIRWISLHRPDLLRLLRIKAPEINKAEVKTFLKNGGYVSGAKLVERQTMGVK